MNIYIVSIFPEIFDSFISTSLIKKAQEKKILKFNFVNPRIFCKDKHQQVDDAIYGGGAGMLIKAKPIIDSVEYIIKKFKLSKFKILFPSPSTQIFNQKISHSLSKIQDLIFVCGRYEGIDYRWEQYIKKKYKTKFQKISLGSFVTLGGELPTMTMIESITRLIPGVIKESESRKNESYSMEHNMQNLEYPQYTRPEEVLKMNVPEILLTGHSKKIQERKNKNTQTI
ncbi:MAG: tRNA (guanosine(37)-N1)-methyltransferase TrmD [Candidatus Absconditicoccaceae bacterium]